MSVDFPILVRFREDSTATVLARITARNGSGAATGRNGEGKFLQQANVSSISYALYNLSSSTPTTATETGTLMVSSVVLDTVVTSQELWPLDTIGYNFLTDIPATWIATGGDEYQLEYKFTLTGGEVFFLVFKDAEGAKAVITS